MTPNQSESHTVSGGGLGTGGAAGGACSATAGRRVIGIYADRARRLWIARDPEGNFWILPVSGTPWEDRQPFSPTEDTELEPLPGHYKHMLGLPY